MSSHQPILSVILVNYKSSVVLMDCLESLFRFDTSSLEVVVVDNRSEDAVEDLLKSRFPAVRFYQMGYNSGFARANNLGIRMSSGDAVLLLNSDTIVVDDAVNRTFRQFMSTDAVACGVQLLNEDGSPQISGNYAMTGGLNYLLPLPYLGDLVKWMGNKLKVEKPNVPDAKGVMEVDWINGAFLMVKRNCLEKAGLLDEDFFLYAEEAEWCHRLKKLGSLLIFGDQHVVHLQGASANAAFDSAGKGYFNLSDRKGAQIIISNMLRIRKEFGAGWFAFMLLCYVLEVPFFLVCLLIHKILSAGRSGYSLKIFAGYSRNVGMLLQMTPRIVRNKPYFYKVL